VETEKLFIEICKGIDEAKEEAKNPRMIRTVGAATIIKKTLNGEIEITEVPDINQYVSE
jgi:hypothetical protein